MRTFGALREKIRYVYAEHSALLDFLGRLASALMVFFIIRTMTGYHVFLSEPLVLVVFAFVAALMPSGALAVFAACLTVVQAFAADPMAAGVALAVFLVLYLLFLRFAPGEGVVLALTVVSLYFSMAPFMPLITGLRRRMKALVPMLSGAVVYALLNMLHRLPEVLAPFEKNDYMNRLTAMTRAVFTDELVILLAAMAASFVFVHASSGMAASYAPYLAVPGGGIIYLGFILIGALVTKTTAPVAAEAVAAGASVFAALILAMFLYPLRYKKSEYLRFEDDAYFYYVKAVPKAVVTAFDEEDEEDEDDEDETEYPGEAGPLRRMKM